MRKIFIIIGSILLISGLIIVFLINSAGFALGLREPHSLKYDDKPFSKIAYDIVHQNEIFEMDDCSRYYKTLNGVDITLDEKEPKADSFFHPVYLKKTLDSFHISRAGFDNLRSQLASTELRSFTKSQDSILFSVDGFLDGSWGFLYVGKGIKDTADGRVGRHYYHFIEQVNYKWSKVSIQ